MNEFDTNRRQSDDIRFEIITKVLTDPDWTVTQAADVLHLTARQVFRLLAKVKTEGQAGLAHGNSGRKPATTISGTIRHKVVELYRERYHAHGYNYSHFTEVLAEDHGIDVSRETVRQWLIEAQLGHQLKRYQHHRRHRERWPRKGQLLFLDGSPHHWFGPQYPKTTLILATDDATGEPLYGILAPGETRNACFTVVYHVAQRFGLPDTFYLDRGSVFKTTRHGGLHARQLSNDATAFQIALDKLGVRIIFADSPQARGRGERMNGSFQGRLVAELSLHGITTYEPANKYINERFIPRYARRFGVPPRDPNPAFRPIPKGIDLRRILCKESLRRVETDNTIRLNGRKYQLYPPPTSSVLYGAQITVQEWFDETVHTYYKTTGEIKNRSIPGIDIARLANSRDLR